MNSLNQLFFVLKLFCCFYRDKSANLLTEFILFLKRTNKEREREKLISPLPRGGRRISSSAFLSRRPFGYYLPIASYGTIFAAKWSSNGGLEAVVSK